MFKPRGIHCFIAWPCQETRGGRHNSRWYFIVNEIDQTDQSYDIADTEGGGGGGGGEREREREIEREREREKWVHRKFTVISII